jgi:TP901 family phage tail tape measure protein|nr:MAG TPA: minor tail protein [Caudoviricetes sp.]
MGNKKFGYDIKIDYSQATENTNRVTSSILQLQQAVERLKRNSDIQIKFTGLPRQLDSITTKTATLANALERTAQSGNLASKSFDGMSAKMQSLKKDGEALAKGLQDSANAIKKLESSNHNTLRDGNKAATVGTQINQLKNQADVLYQAWKANNVGKEQYLQQMTAIQGKLNTLYGQQRRINEITQEHIPTLTRWGFELDKVGSRLGYFATRWAALWVGDKIMDSFSAFPKVEQDMAGFAQVMKHGTGATNAFAKSLLEVDPSNLKNSLQLGGSEAEIFKSELESMQGKLQGLAVQYGTTSHEMIESAKLWGRAYKDNNTVLALTDAATKLAVADAFDIVSANKALESSIMQWGFQINNTNDAMSVSNRIIDSWTSLAHNYTVSAQTLSEANKRMAQSAAEVGVSFHSAQALVAVMARKTQADGGEIGNALKSIFGSIHSKKAVKALQEFGIEVYKVGENGERSFRKVDDVLLDLMIKAQGSKESMEDLLKAISGGKWQWNKADAMLDLKEYLEALRLSSTSMGFTNAQVGMQLDTIQKKIQQIAAQWEKMMTTAGNGTMSTVIKGMLDGVLALFKWIERLPSSIAMVSFAMLGLLVIHRKWGSVFNIMKTSVVSGWNKMTHAAEKYARASRIASGNTTGFKGKLQGLKGAAGGLASEIGTLTGFMGGWVGIAVSAIAIAGQLALSWRFNREEVQQQIDTHSQLLQSYEETYGRLKESTGVLEQFINAYYSLNQKQKEYAEGSEEAKQAAEEIQIAHDGIIQILGEEQTNFVLTADNSDEANQRMTQAVQKRQDELAQQIKHEKAQLFQAAQAVRQQTQDNLDSLQHEKKGWLDRIAVIVQFTKAIDLCRLAYYSLMHAFQQWRADRAAARLQQADGAVGQAESELNALKAAGANNSQIEAAERNLAMAKYTASQVKDEQTHLQEDANQYGQQADQILATTAAKVQADGAEQLQSINSALYGNSGGGGTTGNYPRSELPDGGGDAGKKGKTGKTTKAKNPYSGTPEGEAIDFLIKQGFTANQAYGIVGNLMQESGMDPTIVNASGHHGLAQWDGDPGGRWEQLVAFANANGSDPNNRATQMAFLVHELQTTEHDNWLKVLQHATNGTPEEYAHYFDMFVERSGGAETANRQAYARQLANSQYGDETKTDAERANKLVEKQNKIDELVKKLSKAEAEMENAMKPKEQADLAKESQSLKEKLQGIQKEIDDLIKLNPKADVKKLQETMKKYDTVMTHRMQDKYRDKDYDEAVQMAKDRHENEDLDREIAGTSENFWTKDIRDAQRLVELYIIKVKQYNDMVAAFKRGDSEYTEADIRKAGIELKKLQVQINKTGNDLNKNIRQQTHDVFHSMIFEGKKFKDVWKDLWKQLAEDTLKMLFKIQDGNGGLIQNLLKKKDKKYQDGINPLKKLVGKDGNIGGVDETLNQQLLATQATQNLDKNFATFLANTQNGTAWSQATFTDAVIYGNVNGDKNSLNLPEGNKDSKDNKTDVSQYINAGMKIAGGNNKWMGTLGTVMGFAKQFGLLKFASGGAVNKDQLVRVGEGDKKEWIIPTADKKRGIQLLNQAARDLGVGETKGIEPNWKNPNTSTGALSEQTKRQDRMMNQMVANTSAMTKGMNYMANNGSTHESIAQPVFVKQTISDQDFLAKYNKLVALGKMK